MIARGGRRQRRGRRSGRVYGARRSRVRGFDQNEMRHSAVLYRFPCGLRLGLHLLPRLSSRLPANNVRGVGHAHHLVPTTIPAFSLGMIARVLRRHTRRLTSTRAGPAPHAHSSLLSLAPSLSRDSCSRRSLDVAEAGFPRLLGRWLDQRSTLERDSLVQGQRQLQAAAVKASRAPPLLRSWENQTSRGDSWKGRPCAVARNLFRAPPVSSVPRAAAIQFTTRLQTLPYSGHVP